MTYVNSRNRDEPGALNPTTWAYVSTGNDGENNLAHYFQGMRLIPDGQENLLLSQTRMYDTTLGRWIAQDPAGYVDGSNLYEFVESGPVSGVDPSGLVVKVLEVGPPGETVHDQSGANQVKQYVAAIPGWEERLKSVYSEAEFEACLLKGNVYFAGVAFDGKSRADYLKLMDREKASEVVQLDQGGIAGAKAKLRGLVSQEAKPWDYTVLGMHGGYDDNVPTHEVHVNGEPNGLPQAATLADFAKILGSNAKSFIVSCGNNPGGEMETYSRNAPMGLATKKSECFVDFGVLRLGRYLLGTPDHPHDATPAPAATQPATRPGSKT